MFGLRRKKMVPTHGLDRFPWRETGRTLVRPEGEPQGCGESPFCREQNGTAEGCPKGARHGRRASTNFTYLKR